MDKNEMRKAVIGAINVQELIEELREFSANPSHKTLDETVALINLSLLAIEYMSKSNEVYS